jgi:hypothetical protein
VENRCTDPKSRILVELEADAVLALLNDSYRDLKPWDTWELRHNALAPLRLRTLRAVETSKSGPPMYRIEMRCEQAEALRERCDELAEILQDMEEEENREGGQALERTARVLDDAIRGPLR